MEFITNYLFSQIIRSVSWLYSFIPQKYEKQNNDIILKFNLNENDFYDLVNVDNDSFIPQKHEKKNNDIILKLNLNENDFYDLVNVDNDIELLDLLSFFDIKPFWACLNISPFGTTSFENIVTNIIYLSHMFHNKTSDIVFLLLTFSEKVVQSNLILAILPNNHCFTYGNLISYRIISNSSLLMTQNTTLPHNYHYIKNISLINTKDIDENNLICRVSNENFDILKQNYLKFISPHYTFVAYGQYFLKFRYFIKKIFN